MNWIVPVIFGVLGGYIFHDVLKELINKLKGK